MAVWTIWVLCAAILQLKELIVFVSGMVQTTRHVQGSAILEVQLVSYQNPDGTDWDYNNCDHSVLGKRWKCDLKFTFCFDKSAGSWDPDKCSYKKEKSGEYQNQHDVAFGPKIASFQNPIKLSFDSWPGAIRFKLKVLDDDSFNGDDLVDRMNTLWSLSPSPSISRARWSNRLVVGTRPHTPTSLAVKLRLYCERNYYNTRCSQYCTAANGPRQHYTCDPTTGAKVCRPGWEGADCDVISDDCIDNVCTNGATCQDGRRQYTCTCPAGFAGKYCEIDIDECGSAPCLNGGRCVDQVVGYRCVCQTEYVGDRCSHHVCDGDQSPCLNGGTCYIQGGKARCICPKAFTGDVCERDKCLDMTCLNQGACENGTCVCRPGFLGYFCSLDLCQLIPCMNGASCETGVCRCAPGFTGQYCHAETNECESDPCQHDGTCLDHVNGYTCDCLPAYNGTHCEHNIPTPLPLAWDHVLSTQAAVIGTSTPPSTATRIKSKAVPLWTIVAIVGLINVVAAALVVLFVMRRRTKREETATTVETTVEFQPGQDGEGGVVAFVNPHYDVIPALSCSCAGITPPPYTATAEGHDAETDKVVPSSVDDVEIDDMTSPNTQFTNPTYDVPPACGATVAEATESTAEVPEPIKSTLD